MFEQPVRQPNPAQVPVPPPAQEPIPAPVTNRVDQTPLSAVPKDPPTEPSTGKPRKQSKGKPAEQQAAGKTMKPSANARHKAQNVKKGKTSLHVDIRLKNKLLIDSLAKLTGYPQCLIVDDALRRGLPGTKRHFERQLEL